MLTNTQRLERYLRAIEVWLPNEQRRDILAEISEDLHSRIEEQEEALKRPLTAAELNSVLKQRGRPMLVATRYRPQQDGLGQRSLIGPTWYPSYIAVLKMTAIWYVPAWVAVYVIVRRLQHPGDDWLATIAAAWSAGWTVVFWAAGMITLIFALVEWIDLKTHFMEKWDPRELPAVSDPCKVKRSSSIAEIAVGVVFLLWWVSEASTLVIFDGPAFRLVLTPMWFYFFWGFLASGLANMGLSIANVMGPHWTGFKATLRMVTDLAAGVLFCWFLKAHVIAEFVIAHASVAQTAEVRRVVDLVMERSLPFSVILVVIVAACDLYRVVRVSRRPSEPLGRRLVA